MDEFDRYLEVGLRDMLDPVVAIKPPSRGRRESRKPIVAVIPGTIEFAAEAIPVVEPVPVVTGPVAPARTV